MKLSERMKKEKASDWIVEPSKTEFSVLGGTSKKKENSVAKTFSETIEKFNPYHDRRGRFTTASGAASFTIRTKGGYNQSLADKAIEREKQRTGGDGAAKIKQAEDDLRSVLKEGAVVKFDGMDANLAQETTDSIKRVIDKYPTCKDAFGGFTTEDPRPGYFAESDNKAMACYSPRTGVIHLNKAFYSDKEGFEKRFAESVEKQFHPKGVDYNSVVVHEMGHAIDAYVSRKIFHGWDFAMGQRCSSDIWNADLKKYRKKLGLAKDEAFSSKVIREDLSGYAAKNHLEYLAEGFSEVMCSSNPRPAAKSIVKRLENRMKKMEVD